jgi:hypothetical protein
MSAGRAPGRHPSVAGNRGEERSQALVRTRGGATLELRSAPITLVGACHPSTAPLRKQPLTRLFVAVAPALQNPRRSL